MCLLDNTLLHSALQVALYLLPTVPTLWNASPWKVGCLLLRPLGDLSKLAFLYGFWKALMVAVGVGQMYNSLVSAADFDFVDAAFNFIVVLSDVLFSVLFYLPCAA